MTVEIQSDNAIFFFYVLFSPWIVQLQSDILTHEVKSALKRVLLNEVLANSPPEEKQLCKGFDSQKMTKVTPGNRRYLIFTSLPKTNILRDTRVKFMIFGVRVLAQIEKDFRRNYQVQRRRLILELLL